MVGGAGLKIQGQPPRGNADLDLRTPRHESCAVTWPDDVLLNALPVLFVMSILALAMPAVRPGRPWGGVGRAWLVVFVAAIAVAITNPDGWSISCSLRLVRTGVTSATNIGTLEPCTAANNLPLWLVALPSLLGIGVLLAWVWRHTAPGAVVLRIAVALPALAIAIVSTGHVSQLAALLLVVALVAFTYGWPRIREQRGELKAARPGHS
jgi:hypothetical protein